MERRRNWEKSSIIESEGSRDKIKIATGENVSRYSISNEINYIKKSAVVKSIDLYLKSKVCVRQLGVIINAAVDIEGIVSTQSVYNILPNQYTPNCIAALLNSKVTDFIYQSVFKEKMEFPRILLENLKVLPIAVIDSKKQKT